MYYITLYPNMCITYSTYFCAIHIYIYILEGSSSTWLAAAPVDCEPSCQCAWRSFATLAKFTCTGPAYSTYHTLGMGWRKKKNASNKNLPMIIKMKIDMHKKKIFGPQAYDRDFWYPHGHTYASKKHFGPLVCARQACSPHIQMVKNASEKRWAPIHDLSSNNYTEIW